MDSLRRGADSLQTVGLLALTTITAAVLWRRIQRLESKLDDAINALKVAAQAEAAAAVARLEEKTTSAAQHPPPASSMAQLEVRFPAEPEIRTPARNLSSDSSASGNAMADAGYKTADEDIEGESAPMPALPVIAAKRVTATSPRGRRGADSEDEERDYARVNSPDWAAHSVIGGAGGWSCVDGAKGGSGVGSVPAAASPKAPTAAAAAAASSSSSASAAAAAAASDTEASARAAADAAVLARADEMYEGQSYEAAAELLAAADQSVEVLWRRCRLLKELAEAAKLAGKPKQCEQLLYEGLKLVTAALQQEPSHWAVHKWYAIAISQTSSYEGTRATIEKSFVVKKHFLKASELNPLDATSRHALGMWYWEVASLSWATRKIAAAIFASPPSGTYEEALGHFQLAEGITPGFYIRNRLMIAKCQQQLRDKASARKWAALALELPVNNHDDRTAAADATQLLASL